jgi:hypothetical protein
MSEALTALFCIVIFYTLLSLVGLIQFAVNRYRERKESRKAFMIHPALLR